MLARLESPRDVVYAGTMEERIAKLEEFAADTRERLARIEARLEHMVTKADLNEAIISVIKWTVGTAAVIAASGITVMTFVLNNAIPKAPVPSPTPIIITIPMPAVPASK